ncbi:MAG: hypothetical protein OJF52_000724 [Nitrospira sp.]|jgi:addiction module HigA family antidote|nr:MAG: hypothetical protein OJF52_000724 [Nitrospira sp.]
MRKAQLAPIHPGLYLKELLDELGLSQYRLAHDIGVPVMRISHVVRGTRPLTAELALRLGRYFGQSPRYWINLQSRYDLDMAEDAIGRQVAREVRKCKAVA